MELLPFLIPIIIVIDSVLYYLTPSEWRHPKRINLASLWRVLPLSGFIVYYRYKRDTKDPK